jgi:tRNA1Val (adenine37-N6)-methyltransferase
MILLFLDWVHLKTSDMGRNNYFRFKQFTIIQEKAAMKVGTDGVLLGAWTNVPQTGHILDIGTGTGVIALMLAQRSADAQVTGIEYEPEAARESIDNAMNSPWSNRISMLNISFQEYFKSCTAKFDLIVSNPPFFINSRKPKTGNLSIAKHNQLLPYEDLAQGIAHLLAANGTFSVVLPAISTPIYKKAAEKYGLFPVRETIVRPNNLKPPHRYLMEFKKDKLPAETGFLNIHTDNGMDYTGKYKEFTRDFYLNF